MTIGTIDALQSLVPTAEYVLYNAGTSDESLVWRDSSVAQPSDSALAAEVTRLQTEYNNNLYQRNRAAEYPSVVDQLDDIYHNGIDAWKATIKATKDKYPKP